MSTGDAGPATISRQRWEDWITRTTAVLAVFAALSSGQWGASNLRAILEQGKVTLKHGAIENLGMSPMTMIFRASDPAMISKLKVGDKVKFKADRLNGAITITEITPAS